MAEEKDEKRPLEGASDEEVYKYARELMEGVFKQIEEEEKNKTRIRLCFETIGCNIWVFALMFGNFFVELFLLPITYIRGCCSLFKGAKKWWERKMGEKK